MQLRWERLGNIAEILTGMSGLEPEGAYRYLVVQPNSFSDTGRLEPLETQCRQDEVPQQQMLKAGDVLLKRLNPSFVHAVDAAQEGMVASPNLLVVRPSEGIDPFYLACLLEQKDIIGQVEHVSGNTAAIKAISIKKLAEISIPIAPMEEQKRLGEIWKLTRKRKQLLRDYIAEGDRLVSMMASTITNGGGSKR